MSFKDIGNSIAQPPVIIFAAFSGLIALAFMFLRWNIALPLWVPVIPFLLAMMLGLMYGIHVYTDWNFNPEGADMIYARKTGVPLMLIEAHNGAGKWVRGVKEKAGDIFFAFNRDANEGIHIDPAVQSGSVPLTTLEKGLKLYHYGTGSPFPMGSKQAVAMDEILKYVRKNYKELDVFDSETILEYLARNRNELPHDCKNLATRTDVNIIVPEEEVARFKLDLAEIVRKKAVEENITDEARIVEEIQKMYDSNIQNFVIDYRSDYLVRTFMKIQDETAKLPLPQGRLFSYAEAFINSISAFTAFDIQTLMQLFEMIARKENELELKWLVGIMIGIGLFLILLFVAMSIGKSAGVM